MEPKPNQTGETPVISLNEKNAILKDLETLVQKEKPTMLKMQQKISGEILIVDDNPNNLKLLIAILTEKGYTVRPTTNGVRALSSIHKVRPDLILLDVLMPEMDGYEVCRHLKADAQTCEIPIIFISGLDEVFDKVKAFQMGGVDYITKPFQEAEVLARIESQLTIQHQKHQLQQELERRVVLEAILFQSRALLSSVMNTVHDGIMAYESVRADSGKIVDFKWIVVNASAAKMAGKSADTLMNQHLLVHFPFIKDIGLFEDYVTVVETGASLEKEIFIAGEIQAWFAFTVVKLGDGLAVTFRNTTERKKMEQELERLANLDGLTKIANRRAFDENFAREWKRCQRDQKPLAVILCDVDFFKRFNDTYGHILGDACLREVATVIDLVVKRSSDLVARYGGEEFAAILPETDLEGAKKMAERIADEVRTIQIQHSASDVAPFITLSLGVASWVPSKNQIPEDLLRAADKALYQAKEKGRNQVQLGSPVE